MQKSEIRRKRPVLLYMLIQIRKLVSTSIQQVEILVITKRDAYMNTNIRINTNALIQRFVPILVKPCLLIQTRMKNSHNNTNQKLTKYRVAKILSLTLSIVLRHVTNHISTNTYMKTKRHTKIVMISALRLVLIQMLVLGELPTE